MMRKFASALSVTLVLSLMLGLAMPMMVFAYECEGDTSRAPISIMVVVPSEEPQPTPTPHPNPYHIYPIHVWESREEGRRQIIRVYELRECESPAHIPRESFKRDGFYFELAEIVRRELPVHSVREHIETVSVSTRTNDLTTVLGLLSSTMEYVSADGYIGVLALDVSSIDIRSDGTRTTTHTATTTREFPHLASTDTSLVPRTITDGGNTYNLTNVEWRNQNTASIDYTDVATTFTAVATFSRSSTRSSTIGFTTTAVYRGQLSRIAVGRTELTAYFIGTPISAPTVEGQPPVEETAEITTETTIATTTETTALTVEEQEIQDCLSSPATIENVVVEQVHIGEIVVEIEHTAPAITPYATQPTTEPPATEYSGKEEPIIIDYTHENEANGFPIGNIATGLLFVGGLVLAYFAGKKGKAMLGIMKKASCFLLLCFIMFGLFGVAQTTYAANIPRYGFGAQNDETAMHFNPGGAGQNTDSTMAMHFYPGHYQSINGQNANRSDVAARDGPAMHFNNSSHNTTFSHHYNYGDVIGRLTVERLGRTINVIGGATMRAMDFGAGHFSFTGLNTGNTGLVGHNRGRTNGFFSFVRGLREGDILTLDAGGIVRRYSVTTVFHVDATDFSPLMQFGDNRLTLVTCVEYQRDRRRIAVAIAID